MSGEVGILVQARMSSQRLPGKALLKIGKHPLIYYVVERLKLLKLPIVVCTSTHSSDDPLVEYLEARSYSYFRGSLENVLQRYIDAAEMHQLKNIIRITGDNPLVDIGKLQHSIPLLNNYDYVDGIYAGGGLITGTGFELVKLHELKKIKSDKNFYKEHVTTFLRELLPVSSKMIQLVPDELNYYRDDIFLTCDYPEDLELLRKIFTHFQFRCDIEIEEVLKFLGKYPLYKKLNSHLH